MNKTYIIFKHEFFNTIKRVGFIIMTLIIPFIALIGIGLYELVSSDSETEKIEIMHIGYVDDDGLFKEHTEQGFMKLIPFESKENASEALLKREISEYIIIPADYRSTGSIQRYTLEKELGTAPHIVDMIKRFLSSNLMEDKVSKDLIDLIVSPLNLDVTRLDETGGVSVEQSNIGNLLIPGIFALLLSFALMFGASSLVSGMGEEKESRLIEVLFSSVSVKQLLIGKVLALGLAGLIQVLIWLLSAPLLLNLASSSIGGFMSEIQIPGNFILFGIIYFILGYLLFALLSLGVGAISSNTKEAEKLSLFYIFLGFAPLWFSSLLTFFPDSPIWTVLTIFPVTAPVQTMLRMGVTDIPLWEILTSIGVLLLSVLTGFYITIKIFRVYMLMYGKRPNLKEIFRQLKRT